MMRFVLDVAVYLLIALTVFGAVARLWRRIFFDFRTWLDRALFWTTWIGVSIMAAGVYHVATGDRGFGRALMLLALAVALVASVGANALAARAYSKPYVPEQDPEFMAQMAERQRRLYERGNHGQLDSGVGVDRRGLGGGGVGHGALSGTGGHDRLPDRVRGGLPAHSRGAVGVVEVEP